MTAPCSVRGCKGRRKPRARMESRPHAVHAPARWNAPRGRARAARGGIPLPGNPAANLSPAMTRPACQRSPIVAARGDASGGTVPGDAAPAMLPASALPLPSIDASGPARTPPRPWAADVPPCRTDAAPATLPPSSTAAPSHRWAAHDRRTCQRLPLPPWMRTRTRPPAMPTHGPQDARRGVAVAFPTAGPSTSAGRLCVALEGLEGMGKGRRRTRPAQGPQDARRGRGEAGGMGGMDARGEAPQGRRWTACRGCGLDDGRRDG